MLRILKAMLSRRLCKETYTFKIVEADGFKWIFRYSSYMHKVYQDGYALTVEPAMYEFLKEHAGGIFVDVGAHVGRYSIRLAPMCEKVIAVEPNPYNIQGLLMNIALNKLTNVDVINVALSDRSGKVYTGTVGFREDLANRIFGRRRSLALEVDCKTLDEITDHCDLLKIDTEGYEHLILKGGKKVLQKSKPYIAIETHEKAWNIPNQVKTIESFLKDLNYKVWKEPIDRGDFFLFAEPR